MTSKEAIARMKADADIERVLDALQIRSKSSGANRFILCPNPAHHDSHATNCHYKRGWNSVYCEVCAKSFSSLDIIMMATGKDFKEAVETLWEIEGRPSYYHPYEEKKRQKKKNPAFFLAREESEIVGLSDPGRIDIPAEYVSGVDRPEGEWRSSGEDGYIRFASVFPTRNDFLSDREFAELVARKAREKARYYGEWYWTSLALRRGMQYERPELELVTLGAVYGANKCLELEKKARAYLRKTKHLS